MFLIGAVWHSEPKMLYYGFVHYQGTKTIHIIFYYNCNYSSAALQKSNL